MSAEITTGDLAQFKQDLQATPGASALQKSGHEQRYQRNC